jgi:hypothetical protein
MSSPSGEPVPDRGTSVRVAVVVERLRQPSVWEDWAFRIRDVVASEPAMGDRPRVLRDDGHSAQWLFPALEVELFRDEAEGYHLNLTAPHPAWFVMWRISEGDPPLARVERVTLSYNEAGRLLDAQERVDTVPLPADVQAWLAAYTTAHYKPEPKQRRRPASFQAPGERA